MNETNDPQRTEPAGNLDNVPKFGELQAKIDAHPLFSGASSPPPKRPHKLGRFLWPLAALFLVGSLAYLAVDAGVVKGYSRLPFHVFKQPAAETTSAIQTVPTAAKTEADPYAGWLTYTGDPVNNAPTVTGEGDEVVYYFRYPSNWKYYPIGTKITLENGTESSNSFQKVVPNGGKASDGGISFSSVKTTLSAEDYYKQQVGDQSHQVGPIWQGAENFTTQKGYSAYTSKLEDSNNNVTSYETVISSQKAAVVFNYASGTSSHFATYRQIFDSVNIP